MHKLANSAVVVLVILVTALATGCSRAQEPPASARVVRITSVWPAEILSVPWLAKQSAGVVTGAVVGMSDTKRIIGVGGQTVAGRDVTIQLSEVSKGAHRPGDRVVVQVPGGTVDGVTYEVDDQPEFSIGERVAVMLESSAGVTQVAGAMHGKFSIGPDGKATRDARIPAESRQVPLTDIQRAAAAP